jgi:hypothetical protein
VVFVPYKWLQHAINSEEVAIMFSAVRGHLVPDAFSSMSSTCRSSSFLAHSTRGLIIYVMWSMMTICRAAFKFHHMSPLMI